ncbi:uncharacterized protein LTHEOB_10423 [Lasiodiplodia theobromae]|uniref:uncharacterized protein n=1 Tax=Lasiodiplodia theobromae TaxID=45133 RepID=UPI0015C38C32|nr:uncharacterized protein LTHEOB_10423 [Lasiodiplodia theobromae]KAF4539259.1 hypothetical protein LTHEOB_10423 [Lasiodiplodia theobromae]
MATLIDLPQELRQRILLTAVQQEDRLAGSKWPKTIIALLHVCKTLRRDMPWVLDQWTPLRHLQRPSDLTTAPSLSIDGVACGPFLTKPAEMLYIDLFHDTLAANIRKATWNPLDDGVEMHQALVDAWRDAVPQLPMDKGLVVLDATPAPGWAREGHEYTLQWLMLRGAQAFLAYHIDGIVDLVRRIYQHYAGNVEVMLAGRYDTFHIQSLLRICFLLRDFGIKLPEGRQVKFSNSLRVRRKTILYAVHNLAPRKGTPEVEDWSQAMRLAPLRKVKWSEKAAWLFQDLSTVGGSLDKLTDDMRKLAEVMVDEHGTTVTITEWTQLHLSRRRLIRHMARDMGLRVKSEGEGENRYVVISKESV